MPTNTKNRSPMTPNVASAMQMEIEGGVVSEGGNPDVRDDDKSLDTTQDSLGLGNRILVEDKNEIPSRILTSRLANVFAQCPSCRLEGCNIGW